MERQPVPVRAMDHRNPAHHAQFDSHRDRGTMLGGGRAMQRCLHHPVSVAWVGYTSKPTVARPPPHGISPPFQRARAQKKTLPTACGGAGCEALASDCARYRGAGGTEKRRVGEGGVSTGRIWGGPE